MRLSRATYYADFWAYPVLAAGLAAGTFYHLARAGRLEWLAACAAGLLLWTLIEYLMHRAAFHHTPWFVAQHRTHHDAPMASIGTPFWYSMPALILTFAALYALLGPALAGGLGMGLLAGYYWYMAVHHITHRWRTRPGTYLHEARLRHGRHHAPGAYGDFGVSTALWDHVFGTALAPRRPARLAVK